MAFTHGAQNSGTIHTNDASSCNVTLTLTAGRCYIVMAAGQALGGAHTFSGTSSLDGSLGAADVSSGSLTAPGYIWHINNAVGGSTQITVSPSGSMFSLHVLVRELIGGGLVFDNGVYATQVATTAFDSGSVTPGVASDYSLGFGYTFSNLNLNSGVAGNDGQGNNYTIDLFTSDSTNGDSTVTEDILTNIASASRKATFTAPGTYNGFMMSAFYHLSAGAAPSMPFDLAHTAQHQSLMSM